MYFPDLNHIENNVDAGVMEAQDLTFIDRKSRFLYNLHYGPKKSEGHWHGQIKSAFAVVASNTTSKIKVNSRVYVLSMLGSFLVACVLKTWSFKLR